MCNREIRDGPHTPSATQLCVSMAPSPGPDFSCSLHSVTPMSSSQVRTSDAYLLFYELASPPSRM